MTKMIEKHEKKVMLIAQELKLARVLADNHKPTRDRALKNLKKWLLDGSKLMQLTEDDFLRIWKGLFYSMWMSDKLLIQEECAENISRLVHLTSVDLSMLFFKSGLQTLVQEWFGIDQLRLDKFMMLARRFLRQGLFVLKEHKWSAHAVNKFCEAVSKSVLDNSSKYSCLGLQMHFTEIYWEEVAKVSEGALRPEIITRLMKPFIMFLVTAKDNRLMGHVKKFIFVHLMRQSNLGLEYQDRYEAWKQMGFPGSIKSVQKVEVPEDEKMTDDEDNIEAEENISENILDPRAGRVDVELPQLKFSTKSIINELRDVKFDPETTTKTRRAISQLIEQFQKMQTGIYPFGIKRIKSDNDHYDTSIRKAVNRLVKCEKNGLSRKRNKSEKKRKQNDIDNNQPEKVLLEIVGDLGKKRKFINNNDIDSRKKKPKLNNYIGDPEYIFQRNSGTWFVYDTSKVPRDEDISRTKTSPESKKTHNFSKCNTSLKNNDSESKSVEEFGETSSPTAKVKNCNNSPSPIKLFESSPNIKQELFPRNEWDAPLQEGEYEICISSKKGKSQTPLIKTNRKNKLIINKTVAQLRGKGRLSLDPNLIRDPFGGSPASVKKVKINTKLNRSQEFHEHFSNLLKSPAIPYDASKKPEKPLLKTSTIVSPVNPFTKQLEL